MAFATRSGEIFLKFQLNCMISKTLSILAYQKPTYGELIDLLEEVDVENPNDENLLYSKFKALYPNIYVGRPRRFYETVSRLAAPTKNSLRGNASLTGSPLGSYRKRVWQPRLRNLVDKG